MQLGGSRGFGQPLLAKSKEASDRLRGLVGVQPSTTRDSARGQGGAGFQEGSQKGRRGGCQGCPKRVSGFGDLKSWECQPGPQTPRGGKDQSHLNGGPNKIRADTLVSET